MVTRKRLARGTKLTAEHTHTPMSRIASQFKNSTIGRDQLQKPKAPFRVNLHVPYLGADFLRDRPNDCIFSIPFVVPPLQDSFQLEEDVNGNIRPVVDANTPEVVLDEITISWDTRDEAAAITSWETLIGPDSSGDRRIGYLNYDRLDAYEGIRVGLFSKTPTYLKADQMTVEQEVVSFEIPIEALASRDFRLNPFSVSDINKVINPYQSYVVTIYAPGLKVDDETTFALVSMHISLRFKHPLVARDTEAQNIPSKHGGAKVGRTVTITAPAGGDNIQASGMAGLNTNLGRIDEVFQEGLEGGYDMYSEAPPFEELEHDAAYTIIAVPLFQNTETAGLASDWIANLPYLGGYTDPTGDRRIIPLVHPMTIHHVMLAYNWQLWGNVYGGTAERITNSPTFLVEVGVALGSGFQSDDYRLQPVAEAQLLNPYDVTSTWHDQVVDRIRISDTPAARDATTSPEGWDWEIHQLSLKGSTSGTGWYDQANPVFAGPAWTPTEDRSDTSATGTKGREQYIEVRMTLSDSVVGLGTGDPEAEPPVDGQNAGSIFMGYQGSWIFVVGKAHLTS